MLYPLHSESGSGSALPIVALVDLDNTLFQVGDKCPRGGILHPAAFARDGTVLSFATEKQSRLLTWLARDAVIVPVTGRNTDALRRVALVWPGYAITSFGGMVLTPELEPEPGWYARIEGPSLAYRVALEEAREVLVHAACRMGIDVRVSIVHDQGLPFYLSVKHNQGDRSALARLASSLAHLPAWPAAWTRHLNENNLAYLPPHVEKAQAVRYFIEYLAPAEALTMGIGDSESDAPFMALCDYAVMPRRSQLAFRLYAQEADDAA